MNTAARIAVRLGIDRGHEMLAVQNGFAGLARGRVEDTDWMTVSGWVGRGGAELGTSRYVPSPGDLDAIAEQVERHRIDGLLMVGGWAGYEAAYALHSRRDEVPALDVPIVCLPASINNDLPGSELSVGSDTALNAIVEDVDKIKQSAVAVRRCFVVEVMGHDSGYLALMSGLATGSERVYLPEEGITLEGLREDVELLTEGFRGGKRLGLIIRGEHADAVYTTTFISALLEKEGGDLFDVRSSILGHVQQGGNPTPFDRIIATRLAAQAVAYLDEQAGHEEHGSAMVGLVEGRVRFTDLTEFPALREPGLHRPVHQHWRTLRPVATVMANPGH